MQNTMIDEMLAPLHFTKKFALTSIWYICSLRSQLAYNLHTLNYSPASTLAIRTHMSNDLIARVKSCRTSTILPSTDKHAPWVPIFHHHYIWCSNGKTMYTVPPGVLRSGSVFLSCLYDDSSKMLNVYS